MHSPTHSFINILDHEIHVTLWGDSKKPSLVMWHGLVRNCRDFDELAANLADEYFIICPDTIGRGLSSWSTKPEEEYNSGYYSKLAIALLDFFNIKKTAWLGTSMGGLIGMILASGNPEASRLNCLILNDIGPEIPQAGLDRIREYVTVHFPRFKNYQEAEQAIKTTYAAFGPTSDKFWQRITRSSMRRTDSGQLTLHYDPKIAEVFTKAAEKAENLSIWELYNSITLPTHVLWGIQSDILNKEIIDKMQNSGPKPRITEFNDCGHAPSLSRETDIALIRDILKQLKK